MSPWKTIPVFRNNLRDPFHSTLYIYRGIAAPKMMITIKNIDTRLLISFNDNEKKLQRGIYDDSHVVKNIVQVFL